MKEINLTLTKENEFSFEKPEPYITINIANKETYEKFVDIITKNTPAEVEIEKNVVCDGEGGTTCYINCPECKEPLSFGYSVADAMKLVTKYCHHCGQALSCNERGV